MTYKIAICVPARDTMMMETAQSIVAMSTQFAVEYVATGNASIRFYWMNGTLLPDMRNALVREAIKDGSTHILWIDSDMKFPKDSLARLLKRDLPMVGANYAQRKRPSKPTSAYYIGDNRVWMYTPPADADAPELQIAESMGMGLCLIEAVVYECVPEPWYSMPWVPEKNEHVGEDVFFFRRVKAHLDIDPVVDHVLSREVEHIGYHNYVWQDAYDDYAKLPKLGDVEIPKEAAE